MRESFVFHKSFIESLPEDRKDEFIKYIIGYGLYESEPVLDGMDLAFWKMIKNHIDVDKDSYQKKLEYQKQYYENKNKKKNKNNSNVSNISTIENIEKFENIENIEKFDNFYPNTNTNTNSRRDIDIEYDIDNEFVNDIDSDIDTDVASAPDKSTPSAAAYSKIVFDLFKTAGLPCAKNNEISFLQTDFKNALNYLHTTNEYKNIHSDDVIGAVKNFIEVYQDKTCYLKTKMNFFSLVKSKVFYNLLPQNFDINTFKNWNEKNKPEHKENESFIDYDRSYIPSLKCPKCNGNRIFFNPNINKNICDDCFETF